MLTLYQKAIRLYERFISIGLFELAHLAINIMKTFGLRKTIKKGIIFMIQNIMVSPHKQIQITTKNGYNMYLIPYDKGISKELKTFKIHEPLATKILMKEIKESMNVVDIGSNIGYYVILESKLLDRTAEVIAIEPIKRNFQYLLKNIKINHLCNVKTYNIALSDKEDIVKMINCDHSNKSHILHENEDQTMFNIVEIQTITGDKLLEMTENIGLLRLDVEGHEDHIIEGCRRIIQKWFPDIIIELHFPELGRKRFENLLLKFQIYGYTIKYIIPRIIDFPLVASDGDINKTDINYLLKKSLYYSKAWNYFTLFLRHSSKNTN